MLGTGSDKDKSFEKGGYWRGPLYTIDSDVYKALFGRKGLFSGFYGLADVSRTKLASCTTREVKGNLVGDGLALGGQFVVGRGKGGAGVVVLDHRQKFFGDDCTIEELVEGVKTAVLLEAEVRGGVNQVKEWAGGSA